MRTICGTAAYAAPEIVRGDVYTPSTDIWSLGVVLFAMVAGKLPYESHDVNKMKRSILKSDPSYPKHFSSELNALLHGMLCKDGTKRISIGEMKDHPWFRVDIRRPLRLDTAQIDDKVEKRWSELKLVCPDAHDQQVGKLILRRMFECEELAGLGRVDASVSKDRGAPSARRLKYESGAIKLQRLLAKQDH
jgi:serine/threonine protein kinase